MGVLRMRIRGDFDLGKNLRARPFLFEMNGSMRRKVFVGGGHFDVSISQKGKRLVVGSEAPGKELRGLVVRCLGVNEDLGEFYGLCEGDDVLGPLLPEIRGLRIFSAPTPWETLCCILCSQMTGFPQYKRMVYSIYGAYGGKFPTQGELLKKPGLLAACGVGYRKRFILGCAERFDGRIAGALPGAGPYSRRIYSLFGERDFSSVYDDVLMRRILKERYGGETIDEFAERFGAWAGVAEVYLQKFLADVPSPDALHLSRLRRGQRDDKARGHHRQRQRRDNVP